ncbi:SDR family NAD(P)-dependent oxidoreductase [Erythrobacter sp.]|jgi:3-oxoacyl-[acyl-carrier protein] reductase|uniref:SDR family NAD(P)-dependent oxidoreductase n=1 Tax=Erythrobacter sp. TaxID=1042 RepID=UPI002EC827C4|nr:SDR family NAD(P)-dependent oxidoreductase [Erythrobacter sp.]
MTSLEGRRALVTGAASGIGKATVERFRAAGVKVLACDLTADGLAGDATVVADLSQAQAVDEVAQAVERELGGLDFLVNNAGVCPIGTLDTLTDDQWQTGYAVNVLAPARLIKALTPHLAKSDEARIVNIGSILSSFGDAGLSAYAASKHAILGLTRALANELGPLGITVNCVQPGCIVTSMTRDMLEDEAASAYYRDKSPLGRLGQPDDIAGVIALICAEESRFMTGQGIMVDGGVMTHS